MSIKQPEFRRYLTDINTVSTQQLFTDVLVIGSGIAGMRAAIEAAKHCHVTLVCKEKMADSNTWLAQGGIASVLDNRDTFEMHIADTLKTGCGVCDEKAVELVVHEGPELVRELHRWGTSVDICDGKIATTLEAGHSFSRVAHALGDSTGRGIAESMIKKISQESNINCLENFFVIDLITNEENQCLGVIGYNPKVGHEIIWAGSTILASGGAGRLYRETTNPEVSTADGLAIAYRAGAVMRDMEFMQFHPTTLYIAGASRALVTEALRGEGATLVDCNGYRFMGDYSSAKELAPRDVVSRSIITQMRKTDSTHVYLDVRHFKKGFFKKRFPFIYEICSNFDIDPEKDLIPVRPSAHYMIGGVKTDLRSRTNIGNLYACGEAASTGLHGANRLASNSLLEGLVFGKISGYEAAKNLCESKAGHWKFKYSIPKSERTRLDTSDVRNSLRALMWRNVGIARWDKSLKEAQEIILFWQRYVMDKVFEGPGGWECQNMLTVALLMAAAADMRKESRGVHYRTDYPERNDQEFARHFEFSRP